MSVRPAKHFPLEIFHVSGGGFPAESDAHPPGQYNLLFWARGLKGTEKQPKFKNEMSKSFHTEFYNDTKDEFPSETVILGYCTLFHLENLELGS